MTDATTTTLPRRKRLNLNVLGPLLAMVALIIIGAMLNLSFLSPENLTNVAARSAFIGIIASA